MILFSLLILALPSLVIGQRQSTASICDYYANQLYGSNSTENQLQLVQHIVTLAFAGRGNRTDISPENTGILQPGIFDNKSVNLQSFFNGSLPSTNLNNQGIGINWLDGGGLVPLNDYLEGRTTNVSLVTTTNQFRLFNHFFVVFARLFGCSSPPIAYDAATAPRLNLAYVHKYMNLTHDDLGHFIDQITKAAVAYGFTEQDAETLGTSWNSRFNVRCAPAVSYGPGQAPQLQSLCQNPTCPLPPSGADCDSYLNLTATGAGASPSGSTSTVSGTTTLTATSTPSQTPVAASSSSSLGTGAIAGIAIGGAALILLALTACILLRRRRRSSPQIPPTQEQHIPHMDASMYSPTLRSGMSSPAIQDNRFSYIPHPSAYGKSQYYSGPPYAEGQYGQGQTVIHEVYGSTPVELGDGATTKAYHV